MTDNEIIEAVKEFSQDKTALVTTKGIITFGKIYEFISRLQADKEALIAGQETLQKALVEKNAEIERLLTEFARLKEETTQPYLLKNCDDKSVEALRKVVENQNAVFIPDNGATVEFLDKASIKAEATKELADKIESRLANNTDISNEQYQSIIWDISEACKEMVGDTE